MRYEFSEVLNDLVYYFLLGDIGALLRFKEENGLPDDLAAEFTTSDSADRAVDAGVLLPLAGVENLPYTILFTVGAELPELLAPQSRLQHRRAGYRMKVENRSVLLFTWRILQNFTQPSVELLLGRYAEPGRPIIELENGLYEVEVLAGWVHRRGDFEPAFEFVVSPAAHSHPHSKADLDHRFALEAPN